MTTQASNTSRNKLATAVMVALSVGASGSALAGSNAEYTGAVKDAWLDGRIETAFAFNEHLSALAIDTTVKNGVAILEGKVKSDADRDLAAEVAMTIDGVAEVENNLKVENKGALDKIAGTAKKTTNSLMDSVGDASITASVKSQLMANSNTKGLSINVDTQGDVVTLSGKVSSDTERELAEAIALNTDNVAEVRNELIVKAH